MASPRLEQLCEQDVKMSQSDRPTLPQVCDKSASQFASNLLLLSLLGTVFALGNASSFPREGCRVTTMDALK